MQLIDSSKVNLYAVDWLDPLTLPLMCVGLKRIVDHVQTKHKEGWVGGWVGRWFQLYVESRWLCIVCACVDCWCDHLLASMLKGYLKGEMRKGAAKIHSGLRFLLGLSNIYSDRREKSVFTHRPQPIDSEVICPLFYCFVCVCVWASRCSWQMR